MKRKLAGILTMLLLLTGCVRGPQQNASAPPAETIPVLHLWAVGGSSVETVQRITAALDTLIQDKYGFRVELTMISASNYTQRLNVAFLRGEAPDVFAIYQQSAFNNLYATGQLLNLDAYADASYFESLSVPEELYPRVIRDGNHYGVAQNRETYQSMVYILSHPVAEEFNVDDNRLWSWAELHELLLKIKAAHPEQYPIVSHFGTTLTYLGQDTLGDNLGVLIDERSEDTTVVNLYASEVYYEFCSRMHNWYQEGLITPDAYDTQFSGYIQLQVGSGIGMLQRLISSSSNKYTSLWLSEPSVDTYTNDIMWGVSTQSEHPELAVTLLHTLFTDLDVCKLVTMGEEGVDYWISEAETDSKERIKLTGSNWPSGSWAWPGSQLVKNYYDVEDEMPVPEGTTLVRSPAYGFVFDTTGLESQIMSCQKVVSKYDGALTCGFLDPDTVIPMFLQELEEAGIDTIIAEKQRQLDIWLAQQNAEE